MTCSKKRWRRRSFEAIAARVGNMQARWLRLTVRDSRTPTTRTQKLSRRLLRNDRRPCRASRRAAVTSLFIRTPIRSQTNRKFYAPASLLPENVVYRVPRCTTEGMTLHLNEIAQAVAPGAHALVLVDQAGWHQSKRLVIPDKITLVPLPSK